MTNKHIVIFDSGLGGTTVLEAIQQRIGYEHRYSYVLDNQGFPYSEKPDHFLQHRIIAIFQAVCQHVTPDIIVIACNTASTLLLDTLRQHFTIPIVGVVPAIKPAAKQTQTKMIALLATQATIKRQYVDQLERQFASHCELIRFGSTALVTIAERKIAGQTITEDELSQAFEPLLEHPNSHRIDVMVLGCTHFPAIKHECIRIWPHKGIQWIDSGLAISERVASIIQTQHTNTACQHLGHSNEDSTLFVTQTDCANHYFRILAGKCLHRYQLITL